MASQLVVVMLVGTSAAFAQGMSTTSQSQSSTLPGTPFQGMQTQLSAIELQLQAMSQQIQALQTQINSVESNRQFQINTINATLVSLQTQITDGAAATASLDARVTANGRRRQPPDGDADRWILPLQRDWQLPLLGQRR